MCLYNKIWFIMKVTIKDDFMQRIATEEAWKSLSEDFAWTEALFRKDICKSHYINYLYFKR